jgi:16S rRNA (uracil1498-N3)-methyltransferase
MPRFYIPPHAWNLDHLSLNDGETHHALSVLRMGVGDRATVFNGQGWEATVELAEVTKGRVRLEKINASRTEPLRCEIVLGQAIPKGKNMDLIVEKATELGAAAIVPLLSERTVVRVGRGEAIEKREKWQRVAVEAAKQCGQNWVPRVFTPQTPKEFFQEQEEFDCRLIASLQPDARGVKTVLAEGKRPKRVLILVGPEGDFTPAEVALAKANGCLPITLGPIILRTETAAIYSLSVLGHELFH